MSSGQIVIQGTVDSQGALTLDEPVPLPPGPVEVPVHSLSTSSLPVSAGSFWAAMEEIWAGQRARGYAPRSREEIDAQIARLRDEAEDEMLAVERIHAEGRKARALSGRSPEEQS